MTPPVRRVLVLAGIWFARHLSLTIFVPNRSSLYALLPSPRRRSSPDFCCNNSGMPRRRRPSAPRRGGGDRSGAALPVYWTRNVRWIEIAELSSETFAAVRRVARERPEVDRLVFRDDRSTRRSFADTYDQLLPDAVRLAAGRDIHAQLETSGTEPGTAVRIVLENGRI